MKIMFDSKIKIPYEFTFDDILLLPNRSDIYLEEESKIDLRTKISKNIILDIPIVSSPMAGVTEDRMAIAIGRRGGLGIIHPFQPFDRQIEQVKNVKKLNLKVGAAVFDFSEEGFKHCNNLKKVGVDLICLEALHADNKRMIRFIKSLKNKLKGVDICAGFVVTKEGAESIVKAGVDSVRVGIGGGSHCTTRLVTGVGRPQLSAVLECSDICKKYNVPLISDTGIRYPGDIAKAIACGADCIMIGGLFSGTSESPGDIIKRDGKKYKKSWGSCTKTVILQKQILDKNKIYFFLRYIKFQIKKMFNLEKQFDSYILEEGVENFIPYKGDVDNIILNLVSGLRRSMWYMGVENLNELQQKARIIFVSPSTHKENLPRI